MTERQSKIIAQEKYCGEHNVPLFAPSDGRCFRCMMDIYNKISLDEAGSRLITRCPYCSASFCN